MTSLPLKTQPESRVQCIKKKFEESLLDKSKTVPSKNTHSTTIENSKSLQSSTNKRHISLKTGPEPPKTDPNRNDIKAHVKRTPAFRREKSGSLRNIGNKLQYSLSAESAVDLILHRRTPSSMGKDCSNERVEPLTADTVENLQRSKTDFFNNYCDNKNINNFNSFKSTLISKRVNLMGAENQSKLNDEVLSYAVVDKSKKKQIEKKQKETDLKLSESLRKALQLPLPKGPPPKKPPRTFCHVSSSADNKNNNNNNTSNTIDVKTNQKDLPKLKSKLEKLENLIKTHDRKTSQKIDPDVLNGNSHKEVKRNPKAIESRSLPGALNKRNETKNLLKLSSCVIPCTDYSPSETAVKITENKKNEVGKTKEWKPKNGTKPCPVDEAVMKRSTTTEPIYDLPCVTKCSSEMNKKFSEISNSDVNGNKPEEGLHYLCTDLVNKLSQKPVEFKSADGWNQNSKPVKPGDNFPTGGKDGKVLSTFCGVTSDGISRGHLRECCEDEGKIERSSLRSDSDTWSLESESDKDCIIGSDSGPKDNDETIKSEKQSMTATAKKEILSRKTAQRKDYVSRVSSKLFNSVPYWKTMKGNNSSHLFECCLLVGLTLESDKNVPYIKNIFPPEVKPPPLIEALCFPDATNWPPATGNESDDQYYSLVVTNENGERKFGYCRRVLPEGGNLCLPLTYCIITPHRANGFFYKVLEELESRHGSIGMESFIKQLYESYFPGPGEVLKLKRILEEATKTSFTTKENCLVSTLVRRPCDVRLEEKNLTQLFQYLDLSLFIKVFSSLLLERKVLLLSSSLRKLSSCIEALQSTLLPFSWQHTYIPVLPVHLLEMCEAPTPYVIGLPKTKNVDHSLGNIVFESGIMVDLDESKIIKCCGDEGSILPQRLIKSLKTSLNLAVNAMVLSDTNRNVLISDAFIGFFVQVCGHYSKFITVSEGQKIFERKGFIKYVASTTAQSFLEWFTKTAMFQAFIHERLHGTVEDGPSKLFSQRVLEYSTESLKNSTGHPLNYKILNKKVKSFGDKIKDFIQ
ncbi:hypothetical protein RUM43_001702 [Polyplax serrata]|uniref:UDENN domain-containing protein n=1 Tax=Polyplax serrata TaxID=468196 RepID=A0AAN8SK16_POLSC